MSAPIEKQPKLGPKLKYLNIGPAQADNVHGRHTKDQVIIHETVSPNYTGWADVIQTSEYLDNKDYGIHAVDDAGGNIAWALGMGSAIFYHTSSTGKTTGYANTRGIGIEQVSRVMLDYTSRKAQIAAWAGLKKELNATAKLIAAIKRAHPSVKLVASDGKDAGITTHWLVTRAYGVPGGHVDAWPIKLGSEQLGGYYPLQQVVALARRYYLMGYHF